ncbi:alginate lyase family protein [uncultured Mediterranea sp.]|uniref:alginate lyase family protein n=1 Tax=uncultured Mediterranea sp. TaxID=1926662 RepID=UPI00280548F7|nr:alginate lyase family protein [uncultured Mediterranea sp.]
MLGACVLGLKAEPKEIPVIQVTSVWNMEHLAKVKKQIQTPFYATSYQALLQEADDWLKQKPLSVMMKKQVPASGDKHDYMSIARYYWPDPSKPDGLPYISKDGEVNPEIFDYDRYPLGQMVDRVIALTLAWYFSGEERYAAEATKQVRVWFLDEATRMNPNLEYSQVVMGKDNNKGRSSGLIDTYSFIEMLEAVTLLEKSHSFTGTDSKALKAWFERLTEWMLTSPQGKKESASVNNHSVSYDTQIIAFALYSGNRGLAEKTIKAFPEKRLFRQVEPDGSQPQELRRTLAFHYSRENLTHVINVMLLAKRAGLSIDRMESEDGRSFYKAVDFLTPYVEKGEKAWPYQQISGWDGEIQSFCKDLYRIATCLNPDRKDDYLRLFWSYSVRQSDDRFNLLYLDAKQ